MSKLIDNQCFAKAKCNKTGTLLQRMVNFCATDGEHFRERMQQKRNLAATKAEHLFWTCNKTGTYFTQNAKEAEHIIKVRQERNIYTDFGCHHADPQACINKKSSAFVA